MSKETFELESEGNLYEQFQGAVADGDQNKMFRIINKAESLGYVDAAETFRAEYNQIQEDMNDAYWTKELARI